MVIREILFDKKRKRIRILWALYSRPDDFFHAFLKLRSWQHDLMSAAQTFNPEIHSRPCDFPLLIAARMLLAHFYHITDSVFIRQADHSFL